MIKIIEVNKVEDVTTLNNVAQQVKDDPNKNGLVVKFYADWCGYCKMMKNDWDKLVIELMNNYESKNGLLVIANVKVQSMDENDEIMAKIENIPKDINGIPAIMFVRDGKRGDEYKGDRVYHEMLSWFVNNKEFPLQKNADSEKNSRLNTGATVSSSGMMVRSRSSGSKKKARGSSIKRIIKRARPQFKEFHRDTLRKLHRELRKYHNARSVKNRTKTPGNFGNIPAYVR
jgi:thiol-disulfide isomerase/thioredoxin